MDRSGENQVCFDLDHFCRLTSIKYHLNPQWFSEDGTAERAGSHHGQAGAPSHTEPFHLVSDCHMLLSHHMPLTGCALGKHSIFPRGCELVDHDAG